MKRRPRVKCTRKIDEGLAWQGIKGLGSRWGLFRSLKVHNLPELKKTYMIGSRSGTGRAAGGGLAIGLVRSSVEDLKSWGKLPTLLPCIYGFGCGKFWFVCFSISCSRWGRFRLGWVKRYIVGTCPRYGSQLLRCVSACCLRVSGLVAGGPIKWYASTFLSLDA